MKFQRLVLEAGENVGGNARSIVKFVRPFWTACNELALGIDTKSSPEIEKVANLKGSELRGAPTDRAKHRDNYAYAPPDYWYIRKTISMVNLTPDDVVYDLGCGVGRFLCLVARRRVRKCIGVELFPFLCERARQNAGRLRWKKTEIEVVCADVTSADLSDGTFYFMFNPFGATTMAEVLENLRKSLVSKPRRIRIAYYNSMHDEIFRSCDWLENFNRFHTNSGMAVTFWRNLETSN